MPDVSLSHERLEVRTEADAVGRVHVDHLDLATEAFVLKQAVHHDEAVAEDQTVHPWRGMFVGLEQAIGDV